jgi:hypothetical protein
MKKFWIRKGLMFVTFFVGMTLLVGLVVMGLWNAILPAVLGIKTITFLQALGILLLSKILFGGFHGGFRGRGAQWKQRMQQKMGNMTLEEKEKFKAEWRNRCGPRWNMHRKDTRDMAEENGEV